jgi:hypothetical protein
MRNFFLIQHPICSRVCEFVNLRNFIRFSELFSHHLIQKDLNEFKNDKNHCKCNIHHCELCHTHYTDENGKERRKMSVEVFALLGVLFFSSDNFQEFRLLVKF